MSNESASPVGGNPMTRRRLLGDSARLAAAALAASLMPPNIRRALAEPAQPASLRDIKHVVLLMQENRSFDHYFGTMAGVRGFDDANAMILSHGKSVFHQPDPHSRDGVLLPFHLDTHHTSAQAVPTMSHTWPGQHESWNDGKMDGWVIAHRKLDGAKGPYCMGYYTRDDIPFQFALAEAFTVCDGYHCSVMGPTWPNRMYWFTGMIDPERTGGGPIIKNGMPKGGYRWTTYAERLEKAGVSWKVYDPLAPDLGGKDNVQFNMLRAFKPFIDSRPGSPLYDKGFANSSANQFHEDCLADRLPTVSWMCPPAFASEHPDHMPAAGAAFVAQTIDSIAANPKVWAKTVFIINYDENDGIFDHVPPLVPPSGTRAEFVDGVPIGSGFRVPCIIVSPWTAGGWVCSEPFDHSSVLRFVEKITGVQETNISEWRRKTFGDMTSAFRFQDATGNVPRFPDTRSLLAQAELSALWPKPPIPLGGQTMPVQEKGTSKRVPKPTT